MQSEWYAKLALRVKLALRAKLTVRAKCALRGTRTLRAKSALRAKFALRGSPAAPGTRTGGRLITYEALMRVHHEANFPLANARDNASLLAGGGRR